jgi:hypothetical protein
MRLVKVIAASSVLYVISFVQPIQILAQETFHVRGRIVDSLHSEVAGAEVKFEGSKTTETVFSDRQGFYQARLPIGLYSMTVAKDPDKIQASTIPRLSPQNDRDRCNSVPTFVEL